MNIKKENIGDLLRNVDKVIKSGNHDEAFDLVEKILEINPKNIYAKAYRERIEALRSEAKAKPAAPIPPVPTLPSQIAVPSDPRPESTKTPVIPSKVEQKMSEAVLEAYKTLLSEIWKDGIITPIERERLQSMREFFAITPEEHEYLEQNIRLTCFLNNIKESWGAGIRNISKIKEAFSITDLEESLLKPKIERIIKSLDSKGVILSLDDDKNFLMLVERLLEKHGYLCLNTTSGEEALNLLENFSPDLVLCDIAFGHQNMNGFMFYERFRSIEKFATVPFIFISALNQKELIKTGKKIGVDDYITKPVETDVLLAAIEGRIRRVREMKQASDF